MSAKNAIILVIDRLGAGYLGPYGNTWLDTPHWNRLAAESLLFEFAMTDSVDLATTYRSYWRGMHALAAPRHGHPLAGVLHEAGVHTALLTDDRHVAELADARGFAERIVLPPAEGTVAAETIEQTQLAQTFSAAIDWLAHRASPFMLWLHMRGMQGPWDAPLDFRNQFAEEDDPRPPEFVAPPNKTLTKPFDPDEILGFTHAYAGQVAVLDVCLGALLDALAAHERRQEILLLATAPRGFPLGEHGLVGEAGEALYGELTNVPCLLHLPGSRGAGQRCHDFVQPPDIDATLRDWFQVAGAETAWGRSLLPLVEAESSPTRDRAGAVAGVWRSLRTPAWHLLRGPDGTCELFAKPDDRWEANEVSNRCPAIVEEMTRAFDDFARCAEASHPHDLPPLPETLTSPHT